MGRVYDLRAWRRTRKVQLAAYPLCKHCLARGIVKAATEVDHIIRISDGGDWYDPDNLQSLCSPHHSQKTARDEGKTVRMGCDQSGLPVDAQHHWNR